MRRVCSSWLRRHVSRDAFRPAIARTAILTVHGLCDAPPPFLLSASPFRRMRMRMCALNQCAYVQCIIHTYTHTVLFIFLHITFATNTHTRAHGQAGTRVLAVPATIKIKPARSGKFIHFCWHKSTIIPGVRRRRRLRRRRARLTSSAAAFCRGRLHRNV